jgi:hypothetical protein
MKLSDLIDERPHVCDTCKYFVKWSSQVYKSRAMKEGRCLKFIKEEVKYRDDTCEHFRKRV